MLTIDLRVEWADTYSRHMWWEEEILLVRQEMRRVVAFHESKAVWWRQADAHVRGLSMEVNCDVSSAKGGCRQHLGTRTRHDACVCTTLKV